MIPSFTTVCGVDEKHLRQLALTFPTWQRYKPTLLKNPMVVFCDKDQVGIPEVTKVVKHPDLSVYLWPSMNDVYEGIPGDRWSDPQRYKMLAGFSHVPSYVVKTRYWLKIDTDTVATGRDDWIDPKWFDNDPEIISHRWNYTKPADQMMKLDEWVKSSPYAVKTFEGTEPLNLVPKPGSSRVGHKRIISWCSFFNTQFTRGCSMLANQTCGLHKLPVPSQDGFLWYVAKRLEGGIRRVNMKNAGWRHCSTERNIRQAVDEVMGNG